MTDDTPPMVATINCYVGPFSQQMLERSRADAKAILLHEKRLLTDPEYARKWDESVDWSHWEDR